MQKQRKHRMMTKLLMGRLDCCGSPYSPRKHRIQILHPLSHLDLVPVKEIQYVRDGRFSYPENNIAGDYRSFQKKKQTSHSLN